jgi:hypothetical protein
MRLTIIIPVLVLASAVSARAQLCSETCHAATPCDTECFDDFGPYGWTTCAVSGPACDAGCQPNWQLIGHHDVGVTCEIGCMQCNPYIAVTWRVYEYEDLNGCSANREVCWDIEGAGYQSYAACCAGAGCWGSPCTGFAAPIFDLKGSLNSGEVLQACPAIRANRKRPIREPKSKPTSGEAIQDGSR